jgi:hypothetical protein
MALDVIASRRGELAASMRFAVQQTQQQRHIGPWPKVAETGRRLRVRGGSPSVFVAKGERVAATGAVDQVAGYFQPDQDLPHPRDVVADLFWEQC